LNFIFIIIILYSARNTNDFIGSLFSEDSLFANLTVLFALITAFLFGTALIKSHSLFSKLILVLGMLLFFFFAMEEISWGQTIFGWETSEQWKELNHQNETNIHNLLNPYFTKIYMVFNFFLTVWLLFSKIIKESIERSSLHEHIAIFFPNQSYLYYAFIFFFLVFHSYFVYGGELTEIIFSIFAVSYATNLIKIQRQTFQN
jgi:hypothetical protein